MRRSLVLSTCLLALTLGSCASHSSSKPPKQPKHPFRIALAEVGDSGVSGVLEVTKMAGGVRIHGLVTGLAPESSHAIHIHENGDCTSPNTGTPGGHFNPRGAAHGDPVSLTHHAGDLPNQIADAQGNLNVDVAVDHVSLESGLNDDVLGRSVVVRAGPDDYTSQPDGGGGAAIACGVIIKK